MVESKEVCVDCKEVVAGQNPGGGFLVYYTGGISYESICAEDIFI